jgi:Raf kinase inhibitor-like YbhB/YbcL family protein
MTRTVAIRSLNAALTSVALVVACGGPPPSLTDDRSITVTSSFDDGAQIPLVHTCDGESRAPPLSCTGVEAPAFLVVAEDPSRPFFPVLHWLAIDVVTEIPEGLAADESVPGGGVQGKSEFGVVGYHNVCPPPATGVHSYHFRVYALDEATGLPAGSTKDEAYAAARDHVVAGGEIVGTFER